MADLVTSSIVDEEETVVGVMLSILISHQWTNENPTDSSFTSTKKSLHFVVSVIQNLLHCFTCKKDNCMVSVGEVMHPN